MLFASLTALALAVAVAGAALALAGGGKGASESGGPPRASFPPPTENLTVDRQAVELPPDRQAVPAPIDALEVRVLEWTPRQYVAHIRAGLPGGCAQPYTYTLDRKDATFEIAVLNSMPRGEPACTLVNAAYELEVHLGSLGRHLQPGETYTVRVNGRTVAFTAQ